MYYHSVQNFSFSTCSIKKDKDIKLENIILPLFSIGEELDLSL